jgi:hypothetical protein
MKALSVFKALPLFVAGLAVVTLNVPANAANGGSPGAAPTAVWPAANSGCNLSGGNYSSTCRNTANLKSYDECMTGGLKLGWRSNEVSWYCTSIGVK